MRTWREILLTATAVVAIGLAAPAIAQDATVHGHVQNPAGQPLTEGTVQFTHDTTGGEWKGKKIENSFPIDSNGNYKGSGVKPGDYLAAVVANDKSIDFQQVTLKAGEDKTIDFDMTRAEYVNKLSPEEKKQLEEFKKNASAAMEANKKIANLNATLATVRADLAAARPTAGDVTKDVTDMKAAVD